MASTFTLTTKSGTGTYEGRYLQLSCTQVPDVQTNKSAITWVLSSIGGESNYYSTGPTTVVINGTQVYYKGRVDWDDKIFPAAKGSVSGTLVVDHNTDGAKSISIKVTTAVYSGKASDHAGTWTLDSIPRWAKITAAPGFTDTGMPGITFSNPGGFPMSVWIEPNPVGDHLCVRENISNTGVYVWSLSATERDALRNKCAGTSCTVRLGLYTTIGGVQYADYRDVTYTMTANSATKPSVALSVSIDNSGLPGSLAGLCIASKSRLKVQAAAVGKYGASISNYATVISGKTYTSAAFVSDVIANVDELQIVSTVKASRGFTDTATASVAPLPYSAPWITSFTAERQEDGTTVVARLVGGVSPLENRNARTFFVTLNGVTKEIPPVNGSYDVNSTVTFTNIPTDTTFTATAEIGDSFTTVTKEAVVPTVAVTMDFHHSGKGAAFGKVAEYENVLDVAWDIKCKGNLVPTMADFQGVLAPNGCQKLPGGLMIQWGTSVVGTEDTTISFPAQFSEACYVVVGNPKQYGKQSITFWNFTKSAFTMSSGGVRMNVLWIAIGI